ncbi:hypothetical protein R3P38DRAFT_3116952 [Favolaschia claudopus]|uniref:Fork-head domain-containing protein n=1 Tax=Favolaschia claudopus TaxID=2862362 RepID=A0AAV9ZF85_9AGAR
MAEHTGGPTEELGEEGNSQPSPMSHSSQPSHASDLSPAPINPDPTTTYLLTRLNLPPTTPLTLALFPLPPAGERPTAPLIALVQVAIWSSPERRLTLQGIYDALMRRFVWYRENPNGPWTRSIRHLVSLKAMFVKIRLHGHLNPESTSQGTAYWTLDISQGEGDKRIRKRLYPGRPPVLEAGGESDVAELGDSD